MTDLITLVKKETLRFLRVWKQTLLPPIVTIVLYLLIFWKFMWEKIWTVNWASYIDFIFPWLLMMSVIMANYSNTSSSFFGSKFQKNIEELFISPMSYIKILAWFCIWWIIRWLLVGILVFLVWLLIVDFHIFSYLSMIIFLILSSILFSLAWLLNWIFAKSFDDVTIIPSFVITPMIYLWWVFYSISFLPDFWQTVSKFNPILYMVNWLRYSFIWVSDVSIFLSILIISVFIIILIILNLVLLKRGYGIRN